MRDAHGCARLAHPRGEIQCPCSCDPENRKSRVPMKRSELADLAAFVAVADGLSFRAGAARLGITRSALSHAMQQLEKRLDIRLLHRSTRGVALTDPGRRLFDILRPAFDDIEQALA